MKRVLSQDLHMVDNALCTLFSWDSRELELLEGKNLSISEDTNNSGSIDTNQSYLSYCLGSSGETDSFKSASSSDVSSTKSPKPEITLNALQHEQNSLIEQRIQDRTTDLRSMNTYNTMSYNIYTQRMFPNVELNVGNPNVAAASCLLTNPISSCMFTANRNMQWFNKTNLSPDPWSGDYSQDPMMRSRPCFSSQQTRELEREFTICQYVTRRRRIELAYSLNLTEKQIKTWFQNRRVKERKQNKLSCICTETGQTN